MGVTKLDLHNSLILSLNFAAGVSRVQRQIKIHRCVQVDIHLAMYVAMTCFLVFQFITIQLRFVNVL